MSLATPPTTAELKDHPVVGADEWLAARLELLDEEKGETSSECRHH